MTQFLIAYAAGFLTFFASCLAPLTPSYLGYLTGNINHPSRWFLVRRSIFFIMGFVIIFVLFGWLATITGNILSPWRFLIQRLSGLILIVLGATMTGWLRWHWLIKEYHLVSPKYKISNSNLGAFLFGTSFGLAWTPCVGPALAVILLYVSQQQTIVLGTSLLLIFGLGLATPFLLLALLFDWFRPVVLKSGKIGHYLQLIGGILLIITGLMLLTGTLGYITTPLLTIFNLNHLTL